jgi:hypothetical protein
MAFTNKDKQEIAAIVAATLAQLGVGQAQATTRTATKPATKIAPKGTQKPDARNTGGTRSDVDPNLHEIVVGTGKDQRIKLPARLFDKNNTAIINGTKFHGSPSDGGRAKVQASFFGAVSGDTIRIMRKVGNQWVATVVGAGRRAAGTRKVEPKAQGHATKVAPKGQSKIAPKVKDNSQALGHIISEFAQKAIAGFNAGRVNENLPETDARRYLTSRDKKAFNVQTNALRVKLPEAIEMLGQEVFE